MLRVTEKPTQENEEFRTTLDSADLRRLPAEHCIGEPRTSSSRPSPPCGLSARDHGRGGTPDGADDGVQRLRWRKSAGER